METISAVGTGVALAAGEADGDAEGEGDWARDGEPRTNAARQVHTRLRMDRPITGYRFSGCCQMGVALVRKGMHLFRHPRLNDGMHLVPLLVAEPDEGE
jgi:hypothetical protein